MNMVEYVENVCIRIDTCQLSAGSRLRRRATDYHLFVISEVLLSYSKVLKEKCWFLIRYHYR